LALATVNMNVSMAMMVISGSSGHWNASDKEKTPQKKAAG
jgi:hypothetical protein